MVTAVWKVAVLPSSSPKTIRTLDLSPSTVTLAKETVVNTEGTRFHSGLLVILSSFPLLRCFVGTADQVAVNVKRDRSLGVSEAAFKSEVSIP